MIAIRSDSTLGRRVSSSSAKRKTRGRLGKPPIRPLPIFRRDESEVSVDLLTDDLVLHTQIADEETDNNFYGWAVMLVTLLRQHDLCSTLTQDVPSNPYHVAITYRGRSKGFTDHQFRLELTRCVTAWQDRQDPPQRT